MVDNRIGVDSFQSVLASASSPFYCLNGHLYPVSDLGTISVRGEYE